MGGPLFESKSGDLRTIKESASEAVGREKSRKALGGDSGFRVKNRRGRGHGGKTPLKKDSREKNKKISDRGKVEAISIEGA